jgi:hypothetical protein
VKWFKAPVVPFAMSWHSVQSALTVPPRWNECRPEKGLLFSGVPCAVPSVWHVRHPAFVFTLIVPVRQLGVVIPPWQLTLEQVNAELLNDAVPDFAWNLAMNCASPGSTRSASFPGRALARS